MKKLTTTLAISALFLAPSLALAASIQLTPTQVSVRTGQTFTVTVTATPSGSPIYTVSSNLQFNSGIVQVSSFSLAPTWIAVTQSGYDLTDNTNGSLIKTGGYPDGFNTPTVLGTITFRAVSAGNTTITATGDSVLLDGGSNNELSGPQGTVTVTVTNAPATTQNTATVPVPNNAIVPGGNATTPAANNTTGAGQTAAAAAALGNASGTSQTAAAVNALGNIPQWVWWLILAIIVIVGGYWAWREYFSKNA